jgi:hypothetical protein
MVKRAKRPIHKRSISNGAAYVLNMKILSVAIFCHETDIWQHLTDLTLFQLNNGIVSGTACSKLRVCTAFPGTFFTILYSSLVLTGFAGDMIWRPIYKQKMSLHDHKLFTKTVKGTYFINKTNYFTIYFVQYASYRKNVNVGDSHISSSINFLYEPRFKKLTKFDLGPCKVSYTETLLSKTKWLNMQFLE